MGHGVFTYGQKDINRKIQSAKGDSVAIIYHAGAFRHNTRKNIMLKTAELQGPALDWAVQKTNQAAGLVQSDPIVEYMSYFKPSTNWAQGGPIIDREKIGLLPSGNAYYERDGGTFYSYGPTPLIAAMRCYVASKLGDEVDIPEGLTGKQQN